MRRPAKGVLVAAFLIAGAAGAGEALAAYAIRGFVIGNGATPADGLDGGTRRLFGTAGQSAVGKSSGSGRNLSHGFWSFGGAQVVSVEPPIENGDGLPKQLAFGRPRPNPARGVVSFAIDLPRASRVELTVLDVQGRRVRVVESGTLPAGYRTAVWDGCGESGERVASGVYFARLTVEGAVLGTRRLIVRP